MRQTEAILQFALVDQQQSDVIKGPHKGLDRVPEFGDSVGKQKSA